jgi:polysaccharide export outer membrane protein
MGFSLPLFLTRLAGMGIAAMLLFAVFSHAHAQSNDNYGLNRFPGDNYDRIPPGAGMAPPPAPQGYAPVPGASVGPNGTYSTLNGAAAMPPNYPGQQAQAYPGYQPVPQQPIAPLQAQATQPPASLPSGYRPQVMPQQPTQPTAPYGYRPLPQPAQQVQQVQAEPYGYRPALQGPAQATVQMANAAPYPASYGAYDYVLGPGDKLKLTVYGETDLSGEFTIDGSGYARLPMIGQVRAAGYTARQLEQAVTSSLSQGYLKSPRVSVEVSTYRPFYVIGAVNRPGQYPYIEHMNAMNAIALAGGFNQQAVESVVFLRREGSNEEVEVPVDRTTAIYPGDVIKVHTTLFSDITNWLSPLSGVAASAATAAIIQ